MRTSCDVRPVMCTPRQRWYKLRAASSLGDLLGQLAHVLWLAGHTGFAFHTGAIAELFDAGWRELSWLGLGSANPNPKPSPHPNPTLTLTKARALRLRLLGGRRRARARALWRARHRALLRRCHGAALRRRVVRRYVAHKVGSGFGRLALPSPPCSARSRLRLPSPASLGHAGLFSCLPLYVFFPTQVRRSPGQRHTRRHRHRQRRQPTNPNPDH